MQQRSSGPPHIRVVREPHRPDIWEGFLILKD